MLTLQRLLENAGEQLLGVSALRWECVISVRHSSSSLCKPLRKFLTRLTVNLHATRYARCRVYMKEIYERDGFKGFFTGLNARFVHIGVIVTVQLVVYDMFKNYFGV